MTTQPNTLTNEHAQHIAATRRLRWKTAFAVPLILACTILSGCLISPDGRDRASQESPEFERETLELIAEIGN